MTAILRVLHEAQKPLGSHRIAEILSYQGTDLGERAIRNYLAQADQLAWTRNLGRRGRQLTPLGIQEIQGALVLDKVGFVSSRVDTLAYQMDFDPETDRGKVILNMSTVSPRDIRPAISAMLGVYQAGLGMGRLVTFGPPGGTIGDFVVPKNSVGLGTICSVSINGIFLNASIATTSRFGGLLQMEKGYPKRFTQIINYDGSSLDPLEIFIRGHMTSAAEAAKTGFGMLGASFREVPAVALPEVQRLAELSEKKGIGGVLAIGSPNQPLLDIPVAHGRAGLIVCGGLNPVAAVVEAGIEVTSTAMSTLCDFDQLIDYTELELFASKHGF